MTLLITSFIVGAACLWAVFKIEGIPRAASTLLWTVFSACLGNIIFYFLFGPSAAGALDLKQYASAGAALTSSAGAQRTSLDGGVQIFSPVPLSKTERDNGADYTGASDGFSLAYSFTANNTDVNLQNLQGRDKRVSGKACKQIESVQNNTFKTELICAENDKLWIFLLEENNSARSASQKVIESISFGPPANPVAEALQRARQAAGGLPEELQ